MGRGAVLLAFFGVCHDDRVGEAFDLVRFVLRYDFAHPPVDTWLSCVSFGPATPPWLHTMIVIVILIHWPPPLLTTDGFGGSTT